MEYSYNKKINLIFDCDGTLIDSYGAISDAICRLFLRHGVKCDTDEVRKLALQHDAGYSIREMASRNGLNPTEMIYEDKEIEENEGMISLIPNAEKVLGCGHFNCFVYTHRGQNCREILAGLGISDFFTEIVDRTYGFKRKPDCQGIDYLIEKYSLDRSRTYYVGDRLLDIECGLNAKIGTVFLKTKGVEIDSSSAEYVISDLIEILSLPFAE